MYSGTVQVHVLVLLEIESRLIKALNIAGKRWSDESIKDKLGNRGVYFPACRSLDNGLDFELKILSNLALYASRQLLYKNSEQLS